MMEPGSSYLVLANIWLSATTMAHKGSGQHLLKQVDMHGGGLQCEDAQDAAKK